MKCKDKSFELWIEAQRKYLEWERCFDKRCSCNEDTPIPPRPIFSSVTTTITSCTADYTKVTLITTNRYSGYTLDDLQLYSTNTETIYQENCEECGYVPPTPQEPIYDSVTTISYFCDGYDKMKQIYTEYLSGYSETTMEVYDSITTVELYEHNSEDCGYIPPQPEVIYSSRTEDVDFCSGYDLWKNRTKYYYSGYSESSLVQYSSVTENILIEENSEHCGYRPIIYSSTTTEHDYCQGYDWVNDTTIHYYSGYSEDSLTEYSTSTTSELLEENSEHCGYVDTCKTIITHRDGTTTSYKIEGDFNISLVNPSLKTVENAIDVVIGDCVTSIGDYRFGASTYLTSVTIPNSVVSIGYGAFGNCTSLSSITIPNSVSEIGNNLFQYSTSLKNVRLSHNITAITDNMFNSAATQTVGIEGSGADVEIPNNITKIGVGAFLLCPYLESVELPSSITEIRADAFAECLNLTSLTIPNSVSIIKGNIIAGSINLHEVTYLGTKEQWYNIQDNELWNNQYPNDFIVHCTDGDIKKTQPLKKETVAYYSNGSSEEFNIEGELSDRVFIRNTALERVEIGTGVTSIGDSAFWECRNLSSITISNTVNKIWNYAFYYCTSLTELFIPSSITELAYACFNHCDNLSEITYEGTIEQWNNVNSLMSGLNETHRVIHCTDGDININ